MPSAFRWLYAEETLMSFVTGRQLGDFFTRTPVDGFRLALTRVTISLVFWEYLYRRGVDVAWIPRYFTVRLSKRRYRLPFSFHRRSGLVLIFGGRHLPMCNVIILGSASTSGWRLGWWQKFIGSGDAWSFGGAVNAVAMTSSSLIYCQCGTSSSTTMWLILRLHVSICMPRCLIFRAIARACVRASRSTNGRRYSRKRLPKCCNAVIRSVSFIRAVKLLWLLVKSKRRVINITCK